MRKVRESEMNSRSVGNKKTKTANGKTVYDNAKFINWPPGREDFENLCKAMNLKVTKHKIIEAVMYFRGPELEEEPAENFSFEKLIKWFQMNLSAIQHENLDLVKPEWIRANPHVLANVSL